MPAPIYATLQKRYSIEAIRAMRFTPDGSRMVKRGAFTTALLLPAGVFLGWYAKAFVEANKIETRFIR